MVMSADRDQDIPLATMEELLGTAPVGLYWLCEPFSRAPMTERRRVLDIYSDLNEECDAILLARVRENGPLMSEALDSIRIRPDGRQVITQWVKRRG